MPAPPQFVTILCPKCGQTLQARAQFCQFCQTDVRAVPRGNTQAYNPSNVQAATNWKVVMYYLLGVWWVLNGILITLASGKILPVLLAGPGAMFSNFAVIGMTIGVIYCAVGVGVLLKVELARGIVNILSWITIALAVMQLAGLLLAGVIMGPAVFIPMGKALLDIGLAAFQIYLIAETDSFM